MINQNSVISTSSKPFIKWVGGKRRLLPELTERLPTSWSTYYEPFLGGGALYFHLLPGESYISDINAELINAYQTIQDRLGLLVTELTSYQNDENYYLSIRELDRDPKVFANLSAVQRAARFIYLNKTCFNGLYRVNSKGQFNVPFGHRSSPNFLDVENLSACSLALRDTTITCESYTCVLRYAKAGDFVYFDPPYIPDGISSTFTQYTKDGFGMKEHRELLDVCDVLNARGVKWMLSNSSAPIVYKLYEKYTIDTVQVQRLVGASAESRRKVDEVIVRNY